jgi:hypothetical protein
MTVVIGKSANERLDKVAVTYYPLLVTKQEDDWPEAEKRQRHWALLEDAVRVTDREDFHILIKQFEAITPWILETSKRKISKLTA